MSKQDEVRQEGETDAGKRQEQAEQAVDWSRPETWPREIGGVKGPEPTRYGDWERNGRCSDF